MLFGFWDYHFLYLVVKTQVMLLNQYLFQLLIALIIVTIGFYLKNIMLNIGILIALTIWSVSVNKEIIVLVATPLINRVSKLLNRK